MSNQQRTRREFLALIGAGAAGAGGPGDFGQRVPGTPAAPGTAGAPASGDADLIVVNAVVYMMETGVPRAEAFAIKGGRFFAVGRNGDIKGLAGKGTGTYDAKHMTIVPGFIDCHNHAGGETL